MKTNGIPLTVSFSSKGQIVVPARLRKQLGIKSGTKATIKRTQNGILLEPITQDSIHRLYGILKSKPSEPTLADERRANKLEELEAEERRWKQTHGRRSSR